MRHDKKRAAAAALVLALAVGGCAGLHAYEGPRASKPRLEVTARTSLGVVANPTWRNMDGTPDPKTPAWVTRYTGHMINPTDHAVTVRIDCPMFIVAALALPPRTVQDFLVEPDPDTGDPLACSWDYE